MEAEALAVLALGWKHVTMRDLRVVMYAVGVVVRLLVVLWLISLVSLLSPTPDPFALAALLVLVVVAVFSFRRARRRVLSWVIGTPPGPGAETTARPR